MLVLFDIDDTLFDHSAAVYAAAGALYQNIRVAASLEEFVSTWRLAAERQFARYVAGEISYEEQRRARVRDVIDRTLSDADVDQLIVIPLEL